MKELILSMLCIAATLSVSAESISETDALKKAEKFMKGKQLELCNMTSASLTRADCSAMQNNAYYVFNAKANGGFVIVSGDDRMPDVLGYATSGSYQANNIPPALECWLDMIQRKVTSVKQVSTKSIPNHPAIQPMIQTKWGQDEPYNLFLPNRGDGPTQYYFTGCVATAMAQVMYYNRCPEGMTTAIIPDYLGSQFPQTSFDWDVMQPQYWDSQVEGIDEVCKLMYYCCASVEGQLSFSKTTAYPIDMTEALRRYFGFAETTHSVQRTSFTAEEWDQLIYHELEEGRVVLYSAESISPTEQSAHMFICDGYDQNGLFHINWGWNGGSDGYFLLSLLDPSEEGVDGSESSFGYSINQEATIGLMKATTPLSSITRAELGTITIDGGNNDVWTRSSSGEHFPSITISPTLGNSVLPKVKRIYDTAIGLYKNEERISVFTGDNESNRKNIEIESGTQQTMTISNIRFGKDLSDGIYFLKVLCRESGMEEWQEAIHADDNLIFVNITGNKMTLQVKTGLYRENNEITVNSAVIVGDLKMGEPLTVNVNATNKGPHNNAALYLWCNSDAKDLSQYHLVAGIGTALDAGETGEFKLTYTPWRTGPYKFIISNQPYNADDNHLYNLEADVQESDPVVAIRLLYAEKKECENTCIYRSGFAPILHVYPQYQKEGTFTCNFGLAIYKGEELVRRDGFWSGWTFVDWKVCTATDSGEFFDDLEDGDYRISMDYQVGDGAWIPCIGSDTTFIDMKIYNGKAYFKNRFLNGEGFTVDDMNIEGVPRVRRIMNVNVTATNNTPYPHHCVFLQVNDSIVGVRMFEEMPSGATETKPFTQTWWDSTYDFKAYESGPYTFSVIDGDGNVVKSETINIASASPAKLIPTSYQFVNTIDNCVPLNAKLKVSLLNDSEYIYEDELRYHVSGVWSVFGNDTIFVNFGNGINTSVVIMPHETKDFVFDAYELYDSSLLRATLFYYSDDDEVIALQTPFYHQIDRKVFTLTYMIDEDIYKTVNYVEGTTITPEPQPDGNYQDFVWKDLPEIMPDNDLVVYASYTSGIKDVLITRQHNKRIYSLNGKELDKLKKGLNIVVLSDGTVKKVMVK